MEWYINKDGLWTNGCISIKKGLTPFSDGTFECAGGDYSGCLYRIDNRCVYYVANIKEHTCACCKEQHSSSF